MGILSLTVVKCRKEEGKDKDEIVLLKQNEISSLIMEAATMKKYNTFGVVLVELHRQAASNFILSIVGAGYKML